MAIEVQIKKWGNSFGVLLPKEFVEKERLRERQKIKINLIKETDLSNIFVLLKVN